MNDTPSGNNGPTPVPGYLENGVWIYTGSIPFDQLPLPEPDPKQDEDYEWALTDPEVRRLYGGLVVAVVDRKVWGAGRTMTEAWEAAQANSKCPQPERIVLVLVSAFPLHEKDEEIEG